MKSAIRGLSVEIWPLGRFLLINRPLQPLAWSLGLDKAAIVDKTATEAGGLAAIGFDKTAIKRPFALPALDKNGSDNMKSAIRRPNVEI